MSQMIHIQLPFVHGTWDDLIELVSYLCIYGWNPKLAGIKWLLFSCPLSLVLGMILLNESHTIEFVDEIQNWKESNDCNSAVLCPWCLG